MARPKYRSTYCIGCVHDDTYSNMCSYCFDTGKPRGCPAGAGCAKKQLRGRSRRDITLLDLSTHKPAKLTDEERRNHRNELRRKEYARKKAALLLA